MLISLIILIHQTLLNPKKIDNSFCRVTKRLITSLGGETSYFFLTISLRISLDINEKTGPTDA